MMKSSLIRISLIFILLVLFIPNLTYAETKTFIKEYTYQASEIDSKLSSRVIALEQVKRLLLEELGTYLESKTEVKDFQLTKDQIVILTTGIVTAEIIEERWDGKTYYLKAKMVADPNDVAISVDKLRQDHQKTKELEETRKRADEALREVERLRKESGISKGEKSNLSQYNKAVNGLRATDWFEKGYVARTARRYREAIEAYTMAIELDPEVTIFYVGRARAYTGLRNYRQAIIDLNRAIELNPKYASAYVGRGIAYINVGDYRQAIRDYDQAIELNPRDSETYNHRALAYGKIGDYQQAIRNCNQAIELDPKNAEAYVSRGVVYLLLGDWPHALENYKIAAGLGNKQAQDFLRSKSISW